MLSKLLGTSNVSLTTTPAAVTVPSTLGSKCVAVVMSAETGGSLVVWERMVASDSSATKFCPATEISLEITANPGQTIFYADVTADTATLDVEWWG